MQRAARCRSASAQQRHRQCHDSQSRESHGRSSCQEMRDRSEPRCGPDRGRDEAMKERDEANARALLRPGDDTVEGRWRCGSRKCSRAEIEQRDDVILGSRGRASSWFGVVGRCAGLPHRAVTERMRCQQHVLDAGGDRGDLLDLRNLALRDRAATTTIVGARSALRRSPSSCSGVDCGNFASDRRAIASPSFSRAAPSSTTKRQGRRRP